MEHVVVLFPARVQIVHYGRVNIYLFLSAVSRDVRARRVFSCPIIHYISRIYSAGPNYETASQFISGKLTLNLNSLSHR